VCEKALGIDFASGDGCGLALEGEHQRPRSGDVEPRTTKLVASCPALGPSSLRSCEISIRPASSPFSQRVACPLSAWETRVIHPYSKDLRLRVLAACDRGMSRKEVSETFGVSGPTIRRYLKLRRETGRVDPKPPSGPPPRKGAALEAVLPSQVSRNPDLTLEEHRELFFDEHGMEVSAATVSRALKRLGLPLKKVARSPRARRGGARSLARGGREDRSAHVGVRGRVRDAHLHGQATCAGSQRPAGLRAGPQKPGPEHDPAREHGGRRDGGLHDGGGFHDQGGVRGLRREGPGAVLAPRAGGGDGQPLGAHRNERLSITTTRPGRKDGARTLST